MRTEDEIVEVFTRSAKVIGKYGRISQKDYKRLSDERKKEVERLIASIKVDDEALGQASKAMEVGEPTEEQIELLCKDAERMINIASQIEALLSDGSRA